MTSPVPNAPCARRVLVVDDEEPLRRSIGRVLERAGFEAVFAADGGEALERLYSDRPDVVLVDLLMPEVDGWQTLERIRTVSQVPVLVLTSAATETEKVLALRAGADDYVTKPFGTQELVARVEALLRRAGPAEPPVARYEDAALTIDFASGEIQAARGRVNLTPLEFRLLATFVANAGVTLSADRLLEAVWGDGHAREQVKLYVGYLRAKLRTAGAPSDLIETIRGFGYRYGPPAAP